MRFGSDSTLGRKKGKHDFLSCCCIFFSVKRGKTPQLNNFKVPEFILRTHFLPPNNSALLEEMPTQRIPGIIHLNTNRSPYATPPSALIQDNSPILTTTAWLICRLLALEE